MKELEEVFKFIEVYEELYEKYNNINNDILALQGDFYTNIQMIDDKLLTLALIPMDNILKRLTTNERLASYYLFEMPDDGCIQYEDGTEFKWSNFEEFKSSVYAMIEYNESNNVIKGLIRSVADDIGQTAWILSEQDNKGQNWTELLAIHAEREITKLIDKK